MNPKLKKLLERAKVDKIDQIVFDKWLGYWIYQKQISQEDYENYSRRALGVDANMRCHLVKLIQDEFLPIIDTLVKRDQILSEAIIRTQEQLNKWSCGACSTMLDAPVLRIAQAEADRLLDDNEVVDEGGKT